MAGLIQEKSRIVIKRDDYYHLTTVKLNKTTNLNRTPIHLESLIGHKFGSYFQVVNKQVVPIDPPTYEDEDILGYVDGGANCTEDAKSCDNDQSVGEETEIEVDRLTSGSECGHVTKEEVISMRKEGLDPDQMIKTIASKNTAFQSRTDYSKTKYIKKKLNRYKFIFQVLKPNARLISKVTFYQDNKKSLVLSPMDMGHLLYKCNLFPSCRVILCEGTGGLLTSVLLEKFGPKIEVVDFFTGESPKRENSVFFEFDNNCFANVYPLPFKYANLETADDELSVTGDNVETENGPDAKRCKTDDQKIDEQVSSEVTTDGTECEKQVEFESTAAKNATKNPRVKFLMGPKHRKGLEMYREGGFDCLLLATRLDPCPLLKHAYHQLAPSRNIVVFHSSSDVIQSSADWLSQNKLAVNIQVSEIFSRDYQVLPNRTRPVMKPEETAGYCLSAIKIESTYVPKEKGDEAGI